MSTSMNSTAFQKCWKIICSHLIHNLRYYILCMQIQMQLNLNATTTRNKFPVFRQGWLLKVTWGVHTDLGPDVLCLVVLSFFKIWFLSCTCTTASLYILRIHSEARASEVSEEEDTNWGHICGSVSDLCQGQDHRRNLCLGIE